MPGYIDSDDQLPVNGGTRCDACKCSMTFRFYHYVSRARPRSDRSERVRSLEMRHNLIDVHDIGILMMEIEEINLVRE
jgi:hypothetical protein